MKNRKKTVKEESHLPSKIEEEIRQLEIERKKILKTLNVVAFKTTTSIAAVALVSLLYRKYFKQIREDYDPIAEANKKRDYRFSAKHAVSNFKHRIQNFNINTDQMAKDHFVNANKYFNLCFDKVITSVTLQHGQSMDDLIEGLKALEKTCDDTIDQLVAESKQRETDKIFGILIGDIIDISIVLLLKVVIDELILCKGIGLFKADKTAYENNNALKKALEKDIQQLNLSKRKYQKICASLFLSTLLFLGLDLCFNEKELSPELSFAVGSLFVASLTGMIEIMKNPWNTPQSEKLRYQLENKESVLTNEIFPSNANISYEERIGEDLPTSRIIIKMKDRYQDIVPPHSFFNIIKEAFDAANTKNANGSAITINENQLEIRGDIDLKTAKSIKEKITASLQEFLKANKFVEQVKLFANAVYHESVVKNSLSFYISKSDDKYQASIVLKIPDNADSIAKCIAKHFNINATDLNLVEALTIMFPQNKVYENAEKQIIITGNVANNENLELLMTTLTKINNSAKKNNITLFSSEENKSRRERQLKAVQPTNNEDAEKSTDENKHSVVLKKEDPYKIILGELQEKGILATTNNSPNCNLAFFKYGSYKDLIRNELLEVKFRDPNTNTNSENEKKTTNTQNSDAKEQEDNKDPIENTNTQNSNDKPKKEPKRIPPPIDEGVYMSGLTMGKGGSGKSSFSMCKIFTIKKEDKYDAEIKPDRSNSKRLMFNFLVEDGKKVTVDVKDNRGNTLSAPVLIPQKIEHH